TFHTVENGLITKQKEFWPDEMPPQAWRAQWVKIVSNPTTHITNASRGTVNAWRFQSH
ncbi:nuclear transport factor 2 family protein, partial [Vibrio cholerae]